jgi:hypothetical protein
MRVLVENIKPFKKNTLRGYCDLVLEGLMRINGVSIHCKDGGYWLQMPGKPYTDRDGNQKWEKIIEFDAKRLTALRDLVIDDIRKELGCAKDAPEPAKEAFKPVDKHRTWAKTTKPAKTAPNDSGWVVPNDDLSDLNRDEDIEFF